VVHPHHGVFVYIWAVEVAKATSAGVNDRPGDGQSRGGPSRSETAAPTVSIPPCVYTRNGGGKPPPYKSYPT